MSKTQFTFKAVGSHFELYAPTTKETIKVDANHEKYNWLAGQEAGRVINVYGTGKMTSSQDYYGLYKEPKWLPNQPSLKSHLLN